MNAIHSHSHSLLALGYRIAPAGSAVAVVAAAGDCPIYPWEIATQHKKLGKMMRDWCVHTFGSTIERRAENATTLFYRLHTANARTLPKGFRVDMADHWGRVHSFVVRGEGERSVAYAAGFIMLGGSSLDLSKDQCIDAITMAFHLGDDPSSQGLKSPPVRWCAAVVKARWLADEQEAA